MLNIDLDISPTCIQIWLIGFVVFLLAHNYFTKESWRNLPPGPPALPLVGSLPFLGRSKDIREPLRQLADKYGDVFTIYLGPKRVVVLSGYDAIKEGFGKNGHILSDRPPLYFITELTKGYGLICSQGPFWVEQRRHALRTLREFGQSALEEIILHELEFFYGRLKKQGKKPFCPEHIIQLASANAVMKIGCGRRFDYDDPSFNRQIDSVNIAFEVLGNGGLLAIFPFLRHLPGDLLRTKELHYHMDNTQAEIREMVQEHKVALKAGRHDKKDYMAIYLNKMNQDKDKDYSSFSEKQLCYILADLVGAGSETVTTTIQWALVHLALNENLQKRLQAEIDDVIGRGNPPRMMHRSRMPFTEACILEIQRISDVIPLGVPHAASEDLTLRGYFIPKGTMVMANLYSVHRDPKRFSDPAKFKPERFLDEGGRVRGRADVMPFSVGKRNCLGASLAKMELFLMLTWIFQHFHVRLSPWHPQPNLKGSFSLSSKPDPPCFIILEERTDQVTNRKHLSTTK